MERFKIDDVAKASGLTKRTIRYYEELGLLPAPERTDGGTRLYTQMHIERLKQLIDARDVLGFSLQELVDFVAIREELIQHRDAYRQTEEAELKRGKLLQVGEMLDKQLAMIDIKLEKIAEFRKEIEKLQVRVANALNQPIPIKEGE
ncbi:MerR family transcriptional regulator [Paenibacillus sp. OV219]|uniref:MerR family transcriptional regulator n=1 Tax=Paenibacillus sp. OV219 TaxID=1884377 RepID=UPI0008B24395|nr:MerR family transcriptional regulator [Paenibacillus sp. OV219]SEN54129.1 DNA-binding transcriptional regulator, MerR family [Paenibacillus sp. OV219]